LYGGEFFVNPNTEFDKGMMFPQSLGMFIAAGATISITTLMKMRKNNVSLVQEEKVVLNIFKDKRTYLNLIPGLLQAVGNLLLLVSILLNGNTIAEPLTNLSVVIATLLGIFYMKEKKVQPYMTTTILGLVLIVIGSLACGFMDLDLSIDPTPEG
jgi:glucose uptake protein GlcU